MDESSDISTVLALTARVVAAHVGHNAVSAGDLPKLIRSVYDSLNSLGPHANNAAPKGNAESNKEPPAADELPQPAVPPEVSVFNDYIICLEDGKRQKTLRRHLQSAHGLTPETYRSRWGLPPNYPMVAPDYAERRSELAKRIGLGTKRIPRS